MDTAGRTPVIVGVNGTAASLAAVRAAAAEASSRDRELRVVHAFSWPPYESGRPYDARRREASDVLDRALVAANRIAPRVRASGHLIDGPPARVLLQQSRIAELLVLGDDLVSTGAAPADSVLMQVVARSWSPVLVARRAGSPGGPVLAAIDGSKPAEAAQRWAAEEAARRGARFEAVHAWDPNGGLERAVADEIVRRAGAGAHLLIGDVATEIIGVSAKARLLVIGPRGTSGGHGGTLGSVGAALVRRAACPVIVLHGPAAVLPAPRRADRGAVTAAR